jgi:hypothetical protein
VTKIGDFIVDFVRECEAIFKKALTRVSGPRGSCLLKKTRGRKYRGRVPLKKEGGMGPHNFSFLESVKALYH